MPRAVRATLWFGTYLAVVVAPLVFATIGIVEEQRGFWREFSVSLGFVGLSMMGLQYVLVARIQTLAKPFGEDALVHFHRYMGEVGTVLILAHPILLVVAVNVDYMNRINPFTAPWAGRFGTLAALFIVVVIVTSLWRRALRISYETWQLLHLIISTAAVAAAIVHVELIGHYINQPWKRALWVAMSLGFLAIFVWVRVVRPIARTRRPWRIASITAQPGDVAEVALKPMGHAGFTFAPGQFGWLSVDRSAFSVTQHPFSFSSNADNPSEITMSIKRLGDFTSTIHTAEPGSIAYLDGPHGVFSPDFYEGQAYVFLAGGVGIGPIMSILRTFAARNEATRCYLFYGAKSVREATYYPEICELADRLDLKVVVTVSEPGEDDAADVEYGFVDMKKLDAHLPHDKRNTFQYFICGPGAMQNSIENALGKLGIPADRVHTEKFNFV